MFNLLASECGIVMHEVSRNNRNVFPAELAQLIPQNFSQQISLLIPGSRFLPGILMGNPLEGFPAIIIKRLMNFKLGKTLQIKLACSLSVHHQEQISISQENPKHSMIRNHTISIPPRPAYHPAIVKACEAIFGRHPDNLTPEEDNRFNTFRRQQSRISEPLEEQLIAVVDSY